MSPLYHVINYLNTPLPSSPNKLQRHQFYLTIFVFVWIYHVGINLLSRPEITNQNVITICLVCAGLYLLTFGGSWYLLEEWILPLSLKEWGGFANRTVAKSWLLFCVAIVIGYLLFPYAREPALTMLGETPATHQRHLQEVFSNIFFGSIGIFLVNHVRLKKRADLELKQIRQIQQRLEEEQRETISRAEETFGPIYLSTTESKEVVDPLSITHITVEEHYTCFFIKASQKSREIHVRMTLKDALAMLPEDLFTQIHRSHAVNLRHVAQILRKNGTSQLILNEGTVLPVSRKRTPFILQQLEESLDKN